jgi:hypothetical protein
LVIRLFFAFTGFVAQAPPEGKHGVFVPRFEGSLVLSDDALCVEALCASIGVLCIVSEISAKLFAALHTNIFAVAVVSARKNVPPCATHASKLCL